MKVIFALGNTGSQYDRTRHNAGFAALDALASHYQANPWQPKDKFKALIAEAATPAGKCLLVKPTTYYNLAGESARALMDFYKLALGDILVIHDDLDLSIGTLRTRIGGSDGGSNGLKSLHNHIGQQFARIRIGVAGEHRAHTDAADYVLGRFTAQEEADFIQLLPQIQEITDNFISGKPFPITTAKK